MKTIISLLFLLICVSCVTTAKFDVSGRQVVENQFVSLSEKDLLSKLGSPVSIEDLPVEDMIDPIRRNVKIDCNLKDEKMVIKEYRFENVEGVVFVWLKPRFKGKLYVISDLYIPNSIVF